jgi:hypothetical protein
MDKPIAIPMPYMPKELQEGKQIRHMGREKKGGCKDGDMVECGRKWEGESGVKWRSGKSSERVDDVIDK